MKKIRVLLVDDHSLFREGMATILNAQPDFQVVGEAGDGLEGIVKARELNPDLILMDISMPACDGVEATEQIKRELPKTTIVMLTMRDEDEQLFSAIKSGAQGYLLKNIRSWDMVDLLRGAVAGEAAITQSLAGRMLDEFRRLGHGQPAPPTGEQVVLTTREQQVLGLVAGGATDREIAARLNISLHTAKSHMRNILGKLQITGRHEAAQYALREHLIPQPAHHRTAN